MNPYETPNSNVEDKKRPIKKRSLVLLIPLNVYFWPKLIGFSLRFISNILALDYQTILTMSINLPIYLAAVLLIFRVKVLNQNFWKIWTLLAIADEIRFQIVNYNNMETLIYEILFLSPLYAIAVIYAYFSSGIWQVNTQPSAKEEAI